MRLLQLDDNGDFSLVERVGNNIPSYAILSHTWGSDNEEVTFNNLGSDRDKSKPGYRKLYFCAKQAKRDGLQYFWIDTCCIDKSSSAELSEAIASMFRWYQNAERCYVYLSDVSRDPSNGDRWKPDFRKSRWFTRGWTLQELIAPASVGFFSSEGMFLGSRQSMEQTINETTGIAIDALRGTPLTQFSMDEKFMWAEKRTTKREEDEAYCLLGLFGIHMLPMYGEGRVNALKRLREEIGKSLGDRPLSLNGEQRRMLLESLRFNQIDARHMTIKNAHAKTCKWLSRKSEYRDWLDPAKLSEHNGFLWIKGKPGTGKSTLMKFAFANAKRTMQDRTVLSFFFNARGEDIEKSTIGTYRSLLLQLLERLPALQTVFDSLSLSTLSAGTDYQWSIESLKMLLGDAIQRLGKSPVICFIDALDECEESQIRDMISFFERVGEVAASSGIRFQVCFSSRHYPYITVQKGLDLILEGQEGHTQDITNYLETELKIGKSNLAQQIRGEIQEKASGVFMWVVLVVEILNKEHDRGRIYALRRRLQELPGGLHELFRDILTRDSNDKDELLLCIQWVLFAEQPLSPEQLYFAILSGVEADAVSMWDPSEIAMDVIKRFILDSSKGLTEVTTSKLQKVQFIHESVRDFLLKEDGLGDIWPDLGSNLQGQSHERLKQCCLEYMNVDVFTPLKIPDSLPKASSREAADVRKAACNAFPLLEYAVHNVLYHANVAEGSGITQARFLDTFQLPRWIRLDNLLKKFDTRRHSAGASLLCLLGEHNMFNLIRAHPSAASGFELEKERYGCPLFAAMATGSKEAIEIFLKNLEASQSPRWEPYIVDANDYDEEWSRKSTGRGFKFSKHRGLLSCSAEFGCKRAVSFLIKRGEGEVDSRDKSGRTPLSWAAGGAFQAVVKLLLETGKADINSKDNNGMTPLGWAAERGDEKVVQMLLETGKVDINSEDNSERTPLRCAVKRGHEKVVQALLEKSADTNTGTEYDGKTAVHVASEKGFPRIVESLSSKGSNSKIADKLGEGALHYAAENGHLEMVKYLVHLGFPIDRLDTHGRTPLECARETMNGWYPRGEITRVVEWLEAQEIKDRQDQL